MFQRLRWCVHRLLLLLTIVTATRGATWSHDCVMPPSGHGAASGAVAAGDVGHAEYAGHSESPHTSGHDHAVGGTSHALIAASPEQSSDPHSDESHDDCTCIGDCCTTAVASVCSRCGVVPAPVLVARALHALIRDEEQLPPPAAHLHPFANGPPAASLA